MDNADVVVVGSGAAGLSAALAAAVGGARTVMLEASARWGGTTAARGIDPEGLADTLARFNSSAAQGSDPEFGRGIAAYDRHGGDPSAAHPNLGTVERPPFHAVPLSAGMVGTKGGPRTDTGARVLGWDGAPILDGGGAVFPHPRAPRSDRYV